MPDAEEALRERLHALAAAAGVPAPPLEVVPDPKGRLVAARVDRRGTDRVVVTSTLLAASPAEQDWRLAACLGWWTSPEPRRRHERAWGVLALLGLVYITLALLSLANGLGWPRLFLPVTAGVVSVFAAAALLRWEQRGLDEAGLAVLAAAGYDPVALTREVFGRVEDPRPLSSWWGPEPTPRERIAAAGRSAP